MSSRFFPILFLAGCCHCLTLSAADKNFSLQCAPGAEQKGKSLLFDGKSGFATVKSARSLSIGSHGLTVAMSVRFDDNGLIDTRPEGIDMLAGKQNEWLFGRHAGRLYSNFHDGKKWCGALYSDLRYKPGTWFHVAAVWEPYNEQSEGDIGCIATLYVNGKAVSSKRFSHVSPVAGGKAEVRIGHLEKWGLNWLLHGEVTDLVLEPRAFNAAEVEKLALTSSKIKLSGVSAMPAELMAIPADTPETRWAVEILRQLPPRRSVSIAQKYGKALFEGLQKGETDLKILAAGNFRIALDIQAKGKNPVLGVFDAQLKAPVVQGSPFQWNAELHKGKQPVSIDSATLSCSKIVFDTQSIRLFWESKKPVPYSAVSEILLLDNRLEGTLRFQPQDSAVVTDYVNFPYMQLEKKARKDRLFFPFQSGVLVENPTQNRFVFGQTGWYPSLKSTMQYDAYFAGGRGVYVGMEDPDAQLKEHHVVGQNNQVNIRWRHPVALPLSSHGGNPFVSPGKAVLALYDGEWFEAAMLYRDFLEKKQVRWFCKDLPCKDTPQWYRETTLTFNCNTLDRQQAEEMFRECSYLQEYFVQPVLVKWSFFWFDTAKGNWPVFKMYDWGVPLMKQYAGKKIRISLYLDYYLWKQLDGPLGKSDYRYSTHGKKFAVKKADGSIPTHYYPVGNYSGYHSVMCPGAEGWQQNSLQLIRDTMQYGTQAIYHDQVSTCSGYPCFDPTHGHALNDPAVWMQGYRKLLTQVRREFPDIAHDSEDISEPYLDLFDGAGIWRWTLPGQVPAFQAIYSGRVQFVGRNMDKHYRGDPRSFFVKLAYELVNSEQLGFFVQSELWQADFRRVYLKRLLYLRTLLLPYFNEGRMLAPIRFAKPVPELTMRWGSYYPEPYSIIATPELISNSYKAPAGICWIFMNPLDKTLSAEPLVTPPAPVYRCIWGKEKPVLWQKGDKLSLAPYSAEIWIEGTQKEAERVAAGLYKITQITDPGKSFDQLYEIPFTSRVLTPKDGEIMGPDQVEKYYKCFMAPGRVYLGWFNGGAVIYYGTVDFGPVPQKEVTLRVGVNPKYAGSRIELLTGQKGENVSASMTLTSTGAFGNYRHFTIHLAKPLSGKQIVRFRFYGEACCNFAGWGIGKIPEK